MLVDYKNDIFATHENMNAALRYVSVLCGAAANSSDSIAIRTGAAVLLNTAIELHRAEKQVLVDKINEMSARANPVTALMSLVREQVREAIAEQDVGELIDSWMRDNLGEKIDEHIDIEDLVNDKVSDYFSNNTFTIEPR